uniref:Uncharacterized protein n=1 Tax=Rhizophora mucronata TaxID=61149 RepID=A0A2P2N349_RHIMU
MGFQGSRFRPSGHMGQQNQWEQCIHGEPDESSRSPICYAGTCGSSNWYSPPLRNKPATEGKFPTLKAMANLFESQSSL